MISELGRRACWRLSARSLVHIAFSAHGMHNRPIHIAYNALHNNSTHSGSADPPQNLKTNVSHYWRSPCLYTLRHFGQLREARTAQMQLTDQGQSRPFLDHCGRVTLSHSI